MIPYSDSAKGQSKSKKAIKGYEEAERYRSTGHLPLGFLAVADAVANMAANGGEDDGAEGGGKQPAVKRAKTDGPRASPSKSKDPVVVAAERRLRIMRYLGLASPA